MRTLIPVLALLTLVIPAPAQPVRTEMSSATMRVGDSKSNSGTVPEAYAIAGQFDRVLVLRFKNDTDLLAGLQRMAKEQKIRNAVILSGIGSVKSYHYHTVINGTFPSKNVFVNNPNGPADIAAMNGYILNGRVHAHVTFSDPDKAFGGHLESGTRVFTFAIVTVGVLNNGVDLSRVDDKNYR